MDWTKGRKVWSYLPLLAARGRDPSFPRLCPVAYPFPPHARSMTAPWAGVRHQTSEDLKTQASTRWNLFLGSSELNLVSTTSTNHVAHQLIWIPPIKALILSQKTSFPWECSEATDTQHSRCMETGQSLQAVTWSSFPILLWKAALWASAMLGRAQACWNGWSNGDVRRVGQEGEVL